LHGSENVTAKEEGKNNVFEQNVLNTTFSEQANRTREE